MNNENIKIDGQINRIKFYEKKYGSPEVVAPLTNEIIPAKKIKKSGKMEY